MFFNLKKKTEASQRGKRTGGNGRSGHDGAMVDSGDPSQVSCFDRLHKKEKEEFLSLLATTCATLPEGGEHVLDSFISTEGHVTPEYLRQSLSESGFDIPLSTVKEVLELLCRYGIAQKLMLNGTGPWYEHLHLGSSHDHLVCTKCGKIVEFEDESLNTYIDRLAGLQQFLPLTHKLNIVGVCPECQQGTRHTMPLSLAAQGERVRIVSFEGGGRMKERLNSMGLSIGEVVEILNSSGPFIVNARNSRIAIGKGLAQKVMVSLV